MYAIEDSRLSIKALLQAASDPALSNDQAKALVIEAVENAKLAFGAWAADEISNILCEQVLATYEKGAASIEKIGKTLVTDQEQ